MDVGTGGPPTCFRYPNAASWHHLAAGGLRESVLSAGAAVQTPPSVSPGNLLPVPHGPLSPAPQLAALPCAGLAPGAPPGHPSLPPHLPAQRGDLGSALPRPGWALGACPRCCQRLHSGPPGHAGAPSGTEEQGWGLGAGLCRGPALAAARVQPASLPRVPLPPPPEWCAHRAGLYPLCDGPRQPGTGATGPCRGALVSPRMLQAVVADWSRVLSWLELSERRLEVLHDGAVCRTLARSGFVRFIPCPRAGILPTSHAASTRGRSPGLSAPPAQQCFSGGLSDQSLAVAPASPWAAERPGCWQSSGMPYPSVPLARFPDLHGSPSPWDSPSLHSGASLLGLGEVLLDEQLLLAGIQASLRDASLEAAVGGVQLSKSSVSSLRSWYSFFMLHGSRRQGPLMPTWTDWASSALLSDRLQQLERMGFPTEQAVVALAATGRVEGAVSLLIGGQVGDEAVVTLESRPVCHEHLLPTEQAVPCFPTTE